MEVFLKKHIIKLTIPIVIIIILYLFFSYTQIRFDHNNIRIEGFYKEKSNTIDVAFIGASELYSDYSPVYAYEKYGFTSYNYAIEDNPIQFYQWELDEIYKYQNPKLVVIELSGAVSESELKEESGYFDATLRKITDSAPFFGNKESLINLYGKIEQKDSYFFPLLLYHTAKPSLVTAKDIISFQNRGYSYLKGAVTHTNSKLCSKKDLINIKGDNHTKKISNNQEKYLCQLLNYCKSKKYNVVFARFPHRIENQKNYNRYCEGNYIINLVKKFGFDFIDFEQSVNYLDKIEDFADGEHLRASGSKKFTCFAAEYLSQKYKIKKSDLDNDTQQRWQICVEYINAFYDYYNKVKDGNQDMFLSEDNELFSKLNDLKKE